jgi:hypothetical protein
LGEEIMILRGLGIVLGAVAAIALVSASADAQTQTVTKRTATRGDRTVIVSKDESGRTRTKIIVNRRSFLDPGTQVFPGEKRYNSGPALVYQPAFTAGADGGTILDRGSPPLPGQFDLPFASNPVGRPN